MIAFNQSDDRSRPNSPSCNPPSRVARAAMALPPELTQRLPELLNQYLEFQERRPHASAYEAGVVFKVQGKSYEIIQCIGAGEEAIAYLVDDSSANYVVKKFKNPSSLEFHLSETEDSLKKGLPISRIVDYDMQQGVLVLQGRLGIPFSYLLKTEQSHLSEAESQAVLELFLAFKEKHALVGFVPDNLALDPVGRGVFIFDLF